jgi:hypothetical protein
MFKVLLTVVVFLSLSFPAQAQRQVALPEKPRAKLFDSYAGIYYEDLMARLDNFAIQLSDEPTARAHLIVYGPKGDNGGTGKHLLRISIDYLVNTRGIDEGRLSGNYGGRYKELTTSWSELWLVPAGADTPEAQAYETKIGKLKGKFAEFDSYAYDGLDECFGPCLGDVTGAGFADALTEQPESVAYLVATNQKGAAIGTWRRVAKREADHLQTRGIGADRIKIIFAGTAKFGEDEYPQQARLQLWILPKDAPPPVKEAGPEEIPKVASQLGRFQDSDLKYPEIEKRAFEGFADVLKANGSLGVCIIARPPQTPGFRDPEFPPLENEPPDIDFKNLLDKWKDKLAMDYQIESRRIFVIIASAQEGNDGTIETWIVPPGASLPDPYATDDNDPESTN